MTDPTCDTILYEGDLYDIIAVNGDGMITPYMYNMYPGYISKDCKRDYISKYHLLDGFLLLADMQIGPLMGENPKRIQGKIPDESNTYRDANVWSRFTGSLQIARNQKKKSVDQSDPKAGAKYETMLDILFQDGEFLLARDISE